MKYQRIKKGEIRLITTISLILILLFLYQNYSDETNQNQKQSQINKQSVEEVYKKATVERVIDGDTIIVIIEGEEEEEIVRLIGVDSPESVHPDLSKNTEEGKLASSYTKEKLENEEIELEFDVEERDPYDRLLAYVYLEGELFNKRIVKDGYAFVATYEPNTKYKNLFIEAENQAKLNQNGLWKNIEEGEYTYE